MRTMTIFVRAYIVTTQKWMKAISILIPLTEGRVIWKKLNESVCLWQFKGQKNIIGNRVKGQENMVMDGRSWDSGKQIWACYNFSQTVAGITVKLPQRPIKWDFSLSNRKKAGNTDIDPINSQLSPSYKTAKDQKDIKHWKELPKFILQIKP
jgi:hypothetical protein